MPEESLPIVKAAFLLQGAPFDPEEVTRRLGLEPTETYHAGDPVVRDLGKRRHDGWAIQIAPREALEIATTLRELRDRVLAAPEK